MSCYHPMLGHRSQDRNPETRKRSIEFGGKGFKDLPVVVPCGKCLGCREEKAKEWGARCYHESRLHENNMFVTLTYNDRHLPEGGTLVKAHVSGFMKKLRSRKGQGVRFFASGEYGELGKRPHYHIILFNCDFPDKKPWKKSKSGQIEYKSEELENIWGFGFASLSKLNVGSAHYCAQYSLKKVYGAAAESHYHGRLPEFALMSRNPGIANGWIEKFKSDVFPKDFFHIAGKVYKPPRYYDDFMRKHFPDDFEKLQIEREKIGKEKDVGGVRRFAIEDAKAAMLKNLRSKRELK